MHDTETDVIHTSTEIAEEPNDSNDSVITNLQNQIISLKGQLADAENRLRKSLFRLENIMDGTKLIKHYTGFADYETLMVFYEILESDALVMRQWSGGRSGFDYGESKAGRKYKLPLKEQFF